MYGSTMKKKLYVESRTWHVWKKRLQFQNIYKHTHSHTHIYKNLYVSKNFVIDFNRNFSNKICFIFIFFLLWTDSFLTLLCDIFSCLCLSPSHRVSISPSPSQVWIHNVDITWETSLCFQWHQTNAVSKIQNE